MNLLSIKFDTEYKYGEEDVTKQPSKYNRRAKYRTSKTDLYIFKLRVHAYIFMIGYSILFILHTLLSV